MFYLTDVTKRLLIINVLVYLGTGLLMGDPDYNMETYQLLDPNMNWLGAFFPTSDWFRPYQVVTHMFQHGSLMHIAFNMMGLATFGPPVETMFGQQRFLFYYMFCGFGALGLQYLAQYFEMAGMEPYRMAYALQVPMVGASGAIMGLLAGYATLFPENRLRMLFPPIELKARWFALIYVGLDVFLGFGNCGTGVAHFAHVGGAVFGFMLIQYWRKQRMR
jgi:membrane associated rhomboid family serine protease